MYALTPKQKKAMISILKQARITCIEIKHEISEIRSQIILTNNL